MIFISSKKLFLVICFTILALSNVLSQKKELRYSKFFHSYYFRGPWAYVVGLGTAGYRGDICGRPECNTFRPLLDIGMNYKMYPHLAVGAEVNYFQLKATSRAGRDIIAFSSTNIEVRMYARFYLLDTKIKLASDKNRMPRKLTPYFLIGISALYYRPASHSSTKPYYQSIDKSTSGVTLGIPLGAGLSFAFSQRVSLLAEVTYVNTFSDHLDNISFSSSGGLKDSYGTAILKLQILPFSGYSKH